MYKAHEMMFKNFALRLVSDLPNLSHGTIPHQRRKTVPGANSFTGVASVLTGLLAQGLQFAEK